MELKRCNTCQQLLPAAAFAIRNKSADGLQSRCRACWSTWYAANRQQQITAVRRRNDLARAGHHERIADYLLEHPCVDCGETDLRVLDFDHEDPASKESGIARLTGMNIAWSRIEAEIAKCSVRCANCHRRRTAEQLGYWRHTVEVQRREAAAAGGGARLQAILPS